RALRARGTPGPLLRGCSGVPGLPALAGERPRAQAQDRIDLPLRGAPGPSGPRVAHADSLPRSGSALGRLSHARLAGEGGYGEARRSARGPLAQRWKPEPRRPGAGDHPQAPHPAPEADLLEPKKRRSPDVESPFESRVSFHAPCSVFLLERFNRRDIRVSRTFCGGTWRESSYVEPLTRFHACQSVTSRSPRAAPGNSHGLRARDAWSPT